MGIKLRNLDTSLRNWILANTHLGPGIGDLFFVAKNDSSSNHFRDALSNMGVSGFYDTVTAAYNATTTCRNDIVFVACGAYDEAASIDWTKDNTHLIGLGGPNTQSDYSEKNAVIYTDTAAVDWTIHLTGDHCIFLNIGINNAGANAGNYGPLYVNGYGNYFENCTFIGNMTSQQLADDDCASLHIGTSAHNCKWINCVIGEDCWGRRSAAYSGQISFIGSQPNGGLFRNCIIRSESITATCAAVTCYKGAAGSTHIGRTWIWDNCIFTNFDSQTGPGTNLNEVFCLHDAAGAWPQLMHNCSAYGYDRWTDESTNYNIKGTMPIADDGGGLCIALDQTVAGGG